VLSLKIKNGLENCVDFLSLGEKERSLAYRPHVILTHENASSFEQSVSYIERMKYLYINYISCMRKPFEDSKPGFSLRIEETGMRYFLCVLLFTYTKEHRLNFSNVLYKFKTRVINQFTATFQCAKSPRSPSVTFLTLIFWQTRLSCINLLLLFPYLPKKLMEIFSLSHSEDCTGCRNEPTTCRAQNFAENTICDTLRACGYLLSLNYLGKYRM
jgi:hypothetical protein